jgi:hypothetical protein
MTIIISSQSNDTNKSLKVSSLIFFDSFIEEKNWFYFNDKCIDICSCLDLYISTYWHWNGKHWMVKRECEHCESSTLRLMSTSRLAAPFSQICMKTDKISLKSSSNNTSFNIWIDPMTVWRQAVAMKLFSGKVQWKKSHPLRK